MLLFISSYPKSLFEEKSGCSWWLYSLSPMKCFQRALLFSLIVQKGEKASVLKLNYMLYICKNKAGKDIVQNIEQRSYRTTVLWVPMKFLILSEY